MSEHELTKARSLNDRVETYRITHHHPTHGAIHVGQIGERMITPSDDNKWSWSIGWGTLYAREHRSGTAATRKAAEARWKQAWPEFKAARAEEQWYAAKSEQDFHDRKWNVIDAKKLTTDKDELARLDEVLRQSGPGPTPQFVLDILARGRLR